MGAILLMSNRKVVYKKDKSSLMVSWSPCNSYRGLAEQKTRFRLWVWRSNNNKTRSVFISCKKIWAYRSKNVFSLVPLMIWQEPTSRHSGLLVMGNRGLKSQALTMNISLSVKSIITLHIRDLSKNNFIVNRSRLLSLRQLQNVTDEWGFSAMGQHYR